MPFMLIAHTPQVQIWRFFAHNSLRNYTYVLLEIAARTATVIDPWDGEDLLKWASLEKVKLTGVLNTHGHHDHIRGNEALIKAGVALKTSLPILSAHPVPGHTMDHVAFRLLGSPHFFPGDTLFQAGVGNCKNGGDPGVLYHTVQELGRLLSDESVIHVGHDYLAKNLSFALYVEPSNSAARARLEDLQGKVSYDLAPHTWGQEKQLNPFLRLSQVELQKRIRELTPDLASGPTSDEMMFRALRSLRDNF
jgi:hydroxyacylglutathione hydrolase